MCQFKSALVFQNGDIFASHWTDSHSDLIRMKGVRENDRVAFARVEFRPEATEDLADITKYRLILDELRTPDWWTEDMEHKVREHMKRLVSSMLVLDGEHDLLIGRQYIIGGSAKVAELRTCLVTSIRGSAKVVYVGDSAAVTSICDSATVDLIGGSAKVGCIDGSAKVGCISGSATVDRISGSAKVGYVSGSATVARISGSAKVGYVSDSAAVTSICDSAKVGYVSDSAAVGCIGGSATVDRIGGSAKVGCISGSATVVKDERVKEAAK